MVRCGRLWAPPVPAPSHGQESGEVRVVTAAARANAAESSEYTGYSGLDVSAWNDAQVGRCAAAVASSSLVQ